MVKGGQGRDDMDALNICKSVSPSYLALIWLDCWEEEEGKHIKLIRKEKIKENFTQYNDVKMLFVISDNNSCELHNWIELDLIKTNYITETEMGKVRKLQKYNYVHST